MERERDADQNRNKMEKVKLGFQEMGEKILLNFESCLY